MAFEDTWKQTIHPVDISIKPVPDEFYHITRGENVRSIIQTGLAPGRSRGLRLPGQTESKGGGVYLYSDYEDMLMHLKANTLDDNWYVFAVKLPPGADLDPDEEITSTYGSAWIYRGVIPPYNVRLLDLERF